MEKHEIFTPEQIEKLFIKTEEFLQRVKITQPGDKKLFAELENMKYGLKSYTDFNALQLEFFLKFIHDEDKNLASKLTLLINAKNEMVTSPNLSKETVPTIDLASIPDVYEQKSNSR